MFAVKKNVQMKFARFASGRCGVPPLEGVMEDSVNRKDSLPSVENDLTEAAIRGKLPPLPHWILSTLRASRMTHSHHFLLPTSYCLLRQRRITCSSASRGFQ